MQSTKDLVLFALSLLVVSSAAQSQPPSLFDALRAEGATKFVQAIQSDATLLSLYTSGAVGTVFAPADSAANPPSLGGTQKRDTSGQATIARSGSRDEFTSSQTGKKPGLPIQTLDNTGNLGHQNQSIVTDSRNVTSSSNKRWIHARQSNGTALPSLLRITCGLGQVVNVLKQDIPFDGGVIHIVDNYFPTPETLSATAQALGLSSFAQLTSTFNLTSALDNTPVMTYFVPSQAAFAATSASTSLSTLQNHIIPNFLGYLPSLDDGANLTSQSGAILKVSVKGSNYYINGAKIIQPNIILPNGVVHVVDKIITTPVVTASSGLPSFAAPNGMFLAGTLAGVAALLFCSAF